MNRKLDIEYTGKNFNDIIALECFAYIVKMADELSCYVYVCHFNQQEQRKLRHLYSLRLKPTDHIVQYDNGKWGIETKKWREKND